MIKKQTHPLQTKAWAEFRSAWGNEVINTKYGYITLHKIPFLPYKIGVFEKGPTPNKTMMIYLKKLAKKYNLLYIKLEPNIGWESPITKTQSSTKSKLVKLLKTNGCVEGKTLFTPTTFWINLKPTENDLLKSFSSKTRYNIRLSQRKGVSIKKDNSDKAFENYLNLMEQTVNRQGFYAHNQKYHRLMWKHLNKKRKANNQKPIAHLLTALYQNKVITAWIVFVYDKFIYYPYGASSEKYKNVMANNLMMWEAIRLGKKLGCTTFDLWGREEGKGFTKFKQGYNPKIIEFLGSWDLVVSLFYWPYRLAEYLRWKTLRLKSRFSKPSF